MNICIIEKATNKVLKLTKVDVNQSYITKDRKECVRVTDTKGNSVNYRKDKYNFTFG